MMRSRNVRWSRKAKTLSGSLTLRVGAEARAEERLGHRRHVLVREAHVGAREERVARLHRRRRRRSPACASTMAWRGEDLLAERHRARRRRDRGRRRPRPRGAPCCTRRARRARRSPALIGSSPRVNSLDRDRLAARDARDEAEVGAREQADVLRVLAVDLLDAPGDDELARPPRARCTAPSRATSRSPSSVPLTMTPKPPFLIGVRLRPCRRAGRPGSTGRASRRSSSRPTRA